MPKGIYPAPLQKVITCLSKWPGIGEKTATRLALYLLRASAAEVVELTQALTELKDKIRLCSRCFAFADQELCPICADASRHQGQLCVVADPGDLLALERAGFFLGVYHVLGGLISPLEGVGPEDLRVAELLARLEPEGLQEVVLALNPSLEGESTTAYLSEQLRKRGVKVTRIAYGIPMGGDMKYCDQQTLKEALRHRVEA
ncbi:MAG: recombination protein RecR [Deltaproteobacteria bacterium]|nr:recombination protein RecR [Deltaproteobacteria bacterium]MBW1951713.1 recombination protein RecR [Deltaproteobacteria bacterium]MBW1987584.1 recombination protein RecR [Deltaproteobacteria bacterium]MBW2134726.1 recombination protein RecR [Deltaproteobacteria bacterium]